MNEIKIYLRPSGSLAYLYKDFDLYEGCYRNSQLTVFVPKSLLYENENGTFVNLVKTGAILTAPNGSKLTTKSYYLDYEREQTIGGVEFRVYTTITPKEFCVYAGTQTVVVNVESIDNTKADAQTIISVTTTQTADLIVLESAYLGQDEPIDPTELDKIKATLTEIQSEINEIPNNYVPKASGSNVAYINDQNGATATKPFAVDVTDNALVARDGNGQIRLPLAPLQGYDAVSKKYVDDADNTKLNKVEPFANGTYAYIVSKDDQFGTTNGYTEISETDKISTIVKRKTNGCIETRTPYADVEAANKGYVDTAISNTQGQLAQTNQNVEDLYTILEQAQVVTVTTLEQAYTARETADGENIVDGVQTTVKEIRGKTLATENLIPYPYAETTKTQNGVTFTVNSDGTITVNGTATKNTSFFLVFENPTMCLNLRAGENYTLSGCPKGGSDTTFSMYIQDISYTQSIIDYGNGATKATSYTQYYAFIRIAEGYTANNLVFRPMLNTGSEAKPYSKWFPGLKNAYFEKIVSTGKNLIPYPYADGTVTRSGITFTNNGDGSVTTNGTATADAYFRIVLDLPISKGDKYFLSGCPSGGANNYALRVESSFGIFQDVGNGAAFTAADNKMNLYIRVYTGKTVNNIVFRPMLNYGTSALPYEPYISDTIAAEAPIELPEYDVAYPETGETKRQSNTLTFDGTEAWQFINASYRAFYVNLLAPNNTPSICSNGFERVDRYSALSDKKYIINVNQIAFNDEKYSNVDEWKAHLAEIATAGNPLTVTYKTAEATTEATPFDKSKYIAWKNGSETIDQGSTDNSEYGAENTVKQDYFTLTGGTTNV